MNELSKHRGELARAIANHKVEHTDDGRILIPSMQAYVAGVLHGEHRRYEPHPRRALQRRLARTPGLRAITRRMWPRRGGDVIGQVLGPNVITTEGLNHHLEVLVSGAAQVNPWYIALFEANAVPAAGWTAANFNANATECTAYDETNRPAYVEGAVAGGVVDNTASRAIFTMNATKTVYGGALIAAQTKLSTTAPLYAAARFATARAVVDDDELAVKYTLTLTSA